MDSINLLQIKQILNQQPTGFDNVSLVSVGRIVGDISNFKAVIELNRLEKHHTSDDPLRLLFDHQEHAVIVRPHPVAVKGFSQPCLRCEAPGKVFAVGRDVGRELDVFVHIAGPNSSQDDSLANQHEQIMGD